MEHLLFHWEDIQELLIDDLIEEEVQARNHIEEMHSRDEGTLQEAPHYEESEELPQKRPKAEVDLMAIMQLFEDYNKTEQSILNRL